VEPGQALPEAEREARHLDVHGLGREEVPELVDEDQDGESRDQRQDGNQHVASLCTNSSAVRRARASAPSTSARDPMGAAGQRSSVSATVSAIPVNGRRPSRKCRTATSLAALYTAG